MAVIKDVYAAWIKVAQAAENFNQDGYEWVCDFVMSEKQMKDFKKKYPAKKNSFKEILNNEFEKKFKMDAPFPDQEEQCVIKLKQATKKANGEPNKQPKVYLNTGAVKDGKPVLEDITQTSQMVGNGSKVAVSVSEFTPKSGPAQGKMTCFLSGIRVDDLVEYVQDDELGFVDKSSQSDEEEEQEELADTPEEPEFDDSEDEY